jgi:hypothetical protein
MLDPRLRRKIREHFNVHNQCVPVCIGDATEKTGKMGGWFTCGGRPIRHPSTYAKSGWSNMVYECDTREITITKEWLRDFILTTKPYTT